MAAPRKSKTTQPEREPTQLTVGKEFFKQALKDGYAKFVALQHSPSALVFFNN
jgi:hypothetical protein